jgi:subtilisin-like proprotein convertase family protein
LSWRDVQRLTVENAAIVNPKDEDWQMNGAGRKYSHKYGYGTFDAYKLIEASRHYQILREQSVLELKSPDLNATIPFRNSTQNIIHVTEAMLNITRLEHVTVQVNISHQRRGDVEIWLTSPFGTISRLIESRMYDEATTGYPNWEMSSNAHWDEPIIGPWKLQVFDKDYEDKTGIFHDWTLRLYGEQLPISTSTSAVLKPTDSTVTSVVLPTTFSAIPSLAPMQSPIGSSVGHYISNTPTVLFFGLFVVAMACLGLLAYRLRHTRRRPADQEFQPLAMEEDIALEEFERELLFDGDRTQ